MQEVRNAPLAYRPRLSRWHGRRSVATGAIFFLYVLMLGGVSTRLYRKPVYSMDSIQYMGNALLMEETRTWFKSIGACTPKFDDGCRK
jgi:hypothetical protein